MSSVTYSSKYRDDAIEIEHEGDEVRIWVGNAGGQTFTREQWADLITSELVRLASAERE